MKEKISDGWELKFAEDDGPVDPEFMAALDQLMIVHDDQKLFERVKSQDLWAIIKLTLMAHAIVKNRTEPEKPTIEKMAYYLEATPVEREIFKFTQTLDYAITKDEQHHCRVKFNSMTEEADRLLRLAKKSNDKEHIQKASVIWNKLIELQGTNETELFN